MLLATDLRDATRDDHRCDLLRRIRERADLKGEGIVLSSEGFYGGPTPTPTALGDALDGLEIDVLALCRPYDAWFVSLYKQLVKDRRRHGGSFTDFLQRSENGSANERAFVATKIARFAEAVGAPRAVARSIVGRDAVQLMGEFMAIELPQPEKVVNQSLGDVATAFLARHNGSANDAIPSPVVRAALYKVDVTNVAPDFRLLTPEEADRLYARALQEHDRLVTELAYDGPPPKPPAMAGTRSRLTEAEYDEVGRRLAPVMKKIAKKKAAAAAKAAARKRPDARQATVGAAGTRG